MPAPARLAAVVAASTIPLFAAGCLISGSANVDVRGTAPGMFATP